MTCHSGETSSGLLRLAASTSEFQHLIWAAEVNTLTPSAPNLSANLHLRKALPGANAADMVSWLQEDFNLPKFTITMVMQPLAASTDTRL